MTEFCDRYIIQKSPNRSKLAVHLNAQTLGQADVSKGVTAVLEKGIRTLGLSHAKKADETETVPAKREANGSVRTVVTDVRDFKAQLQVSSGPVAVRDISEFEDLDSKL